MVARRPQATPQPPDEPGPGDNGRLDGYGSNMSTTGRKRVLAIVLAGGEGKRLMPLTADRAKPAVPFAGIYRLIDFALSNVVNSGYLRVVVLTQYKSHSLDRHVTTTWRMSTLLGNYVAPVPAQQRVGKHWYLGSADAIYQSLNLIHDDQPDIVVVVGADHVYRMDFSQMVDQHVDSGATCTVAATTVSTGIRTSIGFIRDKGLPDGSDVCEGRGSRRGSVAGHIFKTVEGPARIRRPRLARDLALHNRQKHVFIGFAVGGLPAYDFA